MLTSITFCGRVFTQQELELMRQTAAEFPALGVTEIARTVCELLEWKRPNGKLKNHEGRQLLERLQQQGWLQLPALRATRPRGPWQVRATAGSDPQPELRGDLREFEPLELSLLQEPDAALWREWIERYHYLGYRVPVGATVRYLVRSPRGILACLQCSSPAWKMAVRDQWIGWDGRQRANHLQRIVNLSRFLILPWVRAPHLASRILGLCARQLPAHWERLYGYRPLLLETLVDARRFSGTCYRAANWILLGQTQGRGRMDRQHQAHGKAPRLVFVYPLCRKVQQRLCSSAVPELSSNF